MGPIKDSEEKLFCEQKDITQQLKQTFFEAAHLKNHRLDENHDTKMINYLQTEVCIPLKEGTLDIWQDEFTLTELEKALKLVKHLTRAFGQFSRLSPVQLV